MSLNANYIDGEWVEGSDAARNINPSDLSDVVGEYARADVAQAGDCRGCGRAGRVSGLVDDRPSRNVRIMLDRAGTAILARKEELGRLLCPGGGQDIARRASARPPVPVRFSVSLPARRCGSRVTRSLPSVRASMWRSRANRWASCSRSRPGIFRSRSRPGRLAPALAFGNCVILKPADLTPGCAWALADILAEAGIPKGRVQSGDGPWLRGRRCPAVRCRGSTRSASPDRWLPAASVARQGGGEAAKRVQLEMGGKNPLVVLDDADLDTAVSCAVNGGVLLDRAALHRLIPADRGDRGHPRSLRRRHERSHGRAQGGPRAERRHPDRARWSIRASWNRICPIWTSGAVRGPR